MKAEKMIRIIEPIDIEINGITLLSIEEYEACKYIIPNINFWWWLRSPGYSSINAANVSNVGNVSDFGNYVNYDDRAVRPALIYESSNLQIGDKIKIVGYNWTVISDSMILCDDVVGFTYFRKDWRANDANDYEKSDIKKWLNDWWKERIK